MYVTDISVMTSANPMYINNPISGRPIRAGGRIYNRLVREGVLQPDEYDAPLPTPRNAGRPKKTNKSVQKYAVQEDDDDEEINQIVREENVAQGKPADYGIGMGYQDARNRNQQEPEDDTEMLKMLQRVAKCAGNSIKGDPQRFQHMTESQIQSVLEHLITEGMERDFEEEKSD